MKNIWKLIAAIAIVGGLVACKKDNGPDNPAAKCYFALATDLSPLGETLVCSADYDHHFVAMNDKALLPVDGQRRYITIEMLGDAADNFVQAGLSASSYGREGWCYAFKTKKNPAPYGLEGSAKIVYDDGTLRFEKTVALVTPELTDLSGGCEAVDLGLSVKWASYNVGAQNVDGRGSYFAWGETTEKTNYDWAKEGDYKWGIHDNSASPKYGMTKYTADVEGGDGLKTLQPGDDPATANWGTKWRTPTLDEIEELLDNTKCEWIWDAAKKGYTVKGLKTGNSIFLPAAGSYGSELWNAGTHGNYWSSSVRKSDPIRACCLYLSSDYLDYGYNWRCYGQSVRAVTEY